MPAIGVKAILLGAAVVLFVIAWLSNENYADMVALGLALFAAAFLIENLGMDRRVR